MNRYGLCEYFIVCEVVLSGVRPLVGVDVKKHRISDRSLFVRLSLWGRSLMRKCYAHSWRGSRGRCKGSCSAARKEAGIVIWKWNVSGEGCFFGECLNVAGMSRLKGQDERGGHDSHRHHCQPGFESRPRRKWSQNKARNNFSLDSFSRLFS